MNENEKLDHECCTMRVTDNIPEEIVCGRSPIMADAARSNCSVSCKLGQVDVEFGTAVLGG